LPPRPLGFSANTGAPSAPIAVSTSPGVHGHADPVRGQLDGSRLGEADHAVLGRAVVGLTGQRFDPAVELVQMMEPPRPDSIVAGTAARTVW
jgi:hypothetical protein